MRQPSTKIQQPLTIKKITSKKRMLVVTKSWKLRKRRCSQTESLVTVQPLWQPSAEIHQPHQDVWVWGYSELVSIGFSNNSSHNTFPDRFHIQQLKLWEFLNSNLVTQAKLIFYKKTKFRVFNQIRLMSVLKMFNEWNKFNYMFLNINIIQILWKRNLQTCYH